MPGTMLLEGWQNVMCVFFFTHIVFYCTAGRGVDIAFKSSKLHVPSAISAVIQT